MKKLRRFFTFQARRKFFDKNFVWTSVFLRAMFFYVHQHTENDVRFFSVHGNWKCFLFPKFRSFIQKLRLFYVVSVPVCLTDKSSRFSCIFFFFWKIEISAKKIIIEYFMKFHFCLISSVSFSYSEVFFYIFKKYSYS